MDVLGNWVVGVAVFIVACVVIGVGIRISKEIWPWEWPQVAKIDIPQELESSSMTAEEIEEAAQPESASLRNHRKAQEAIERMNATQKANDIESRAEAKAQRIFDSAEAKADAIMGINEVGTPPDYKPQGRVEIMDDEDDEGPLP